jgi:hypothetical protein
MTSNIPTQIANAAPSQIAPPVPGRDHALDSTAINSVLAQFWQTLESGQVRNLRKTYPDMPKEWDGMWGTFVDFAKDLDVNSTIGKLKFDGDRVETTNQVKMAFRDRNGQKNQDVRYTARLERQGNQWIITELKQDR